MPEQPGAASRDLHDHCVLAAPTPTRWAREAALHLDELLQEQAHLEKKAAAAALRFLFQVPQSDWMHRALSQLAREELVHFERTLRLLRRRGLEPARLQPCPYAEGLKRACARTMPARLLDELLVAALIEARSHERMAALGHALEGRDAEAAAFYRELVEAEARHRCTYLDVAAALFGAPSVVARFGELAAHEAALVAHPASAPRLHGGHGGQGG
ncbi:MAG: tRNA isopentenyl-2-thiomethyl-A-37 hydroxylase MiaE [Planctomycetota bacterium]